MARRCLIPALIELMWPSFQPVADKVEPEWDPLRRDDLLDENELVDVRLDTGRSTAGLIIVQGGGGELVRVIVAFRVRAMDWTVTGHHVLGFGQRFNRAIGSSRCTPTREGLLHLQLGVQGDANLRLRPPRACNIDLSITAAEFTSYDVHIEGLPDAPPDYRDLDDAEIDLQRPHWNSPCRIMAWSRRTP